MPSIQHYLIADPARQLMIHHRRPEDGIATTIHCEGSVRLGPPGIACEVADCFSSIY